MSQRIETRRDVEGATANAGITWQRLAGVAALAQSVALLVTAAVLRDLEAAAVGVGFLIGLGLLRVRRGGLGRVALALLFANVLGWMSLATVTNVATGQALDAALRR